MYQSTATAFASRVGGKDQRKDESREGKAMASNVTEVGVSVGGFINAGGVLGVEVRVNFFQDGRYVELSTTAPFDVTAQQARALVKAALIDAGYGTILDAAKFRVVGI